MAKKKRKSAEALQEDERRFVEEAKPKKSKAATTRATEGISFRVTPELAMRFRKAVGDRSVTLEEPHKKQDVLAEALTEWLEKYGY